MLIQPIAQRYARGVVVWVLDIGIHLRVQTVKAFSTVIANLLRLGESKVLPTAPVNGPMVAMKWPLATSSFL